MSIDPRLVERRQTVAEDNAKRNMWRLLKFLAFVVVMGGLVWLVFSPWLSVSRVDTNGVESSQANTILADHRVVAGTPMIQIDPGGVEESLLEDPWIAEATVGRRWPNVVTVDIIERTPVAWTLTADGWMRRAVDGVALSSADEPDSGMARIEMPDLAEVAVATTPDMVGALEFVDALADPLRADTVVTLIDGEIWATVDGFQTRLGRAVDMREKGVALTALLEENLAPGSVLVLIAPTNPAVMTPGANTTTRDDDTGDGTDATDEEGGDEGGVVDD